MVAVGTRISPRPPRRSRRALLTHRAPPSGSGVEAVTGQRVYSSDWRKEAGDELDEPLPAEACRLAAPLERCEPKPLHLVEEPPQARVVTRDREVVQMPFQLLFHPSTGFRDGVVHYPTQLDLDRGSGLHRTIRNRGSEWLGDAHIHQATDGARPKKVGCDL